MIQSTSGPAPSWVQPARRWATANAAPLVGALAVVVLLFTTYYPALNIGFWTDDYLFVEAAGRLPLQQYLTLYFDPRVQVTWYRPMQGMQWRTEYAVFHADPFGYHLVQLSYEVVNCLLLFALVARLSRKWRIGFAAAAIYATLTAYSIAVVWIAVPDALASVFYLSASLLWLDYLESGRKLTYLLTFPVLIGALLSKEMAATLPAFLFLIDRGLVRKLVQQRETPAYQTEADRPTNPEQNLGCAPHFHVDALQVSPIELIKRYLPFAPILVVYAGLEFTAVTQGVFARDWGYGVGRNNLSVLAAYLSRLLIPWDVDPQTRVIWLLIVLGALAYAVAKREVRILVLAAVAVLIVLPVVPFQSLNARYLYLPMMVSAVGIALVAESYARILRALRLDGRLALAGTGVMSLVLLSVMLAGSSTTTDFAENIAGVARQTRLQFRPIFQEHPSFPPGAFLYFFDQPFTTPNISGMMFLRYGPNVSVSGSDIDRTADWRDHNEAFVYYLDSQNTMREQPVDPQAAAQSDSSLPVSFEKGISLRGFEAAANGVKRGEALTLLLYWQTTTRIDKDYTVFAHLLDLNGNIVSSYDSQPKRGNAPTSAWKPGSLVVDPVVLPINEDAPIGDGYRIEIGMYDPATGQRISKLSPDGTSVGTAVDLEYFGIKP